MTMHYVVVSDGIDATWGEHLSTGECSISHTFQVQWETCDQALV